jgi:hypothetical protein
VKKSAGALRQAQGERKKRNEFEANAARAEPVEAPVITCGPFFHSLSLRRSFVELSGKAP